MTQPATNGPDLQPDVTDTVGLSHASLCFDGCGVTLWSDPGVTFPGQTVAETQLLMRPQRPVVIGRQQGGEVPYLDPGYTSTPILPDTQQSVLTRAGRDQDLAVSRGHFMLKASPGGIVLLNGVPKRGGGVRPPLNGTWLLEPENRRMEDGEEYLIQNGQSARIHLPNGTRILINAG